MLNIPLGVLGVLIILLFMISGFAVIPACGDYSIGTVIDTTGMVKDSFSGSWGYADDDNGTRMSGVYSNSEMTNGGRFTLNKQTGLRETKTYGPELETENVLSYSSDHSGGHLLADEYLSTSTYTAANSTDEGICVFYSENNTTVPGSSYKHSASFTITNAQQLQLTAAARTSGKDMDYRISVGSQNENGTEEELDGTMITEFRHRSGTKEGGKELYDRTLVSGLINVLTRIYHAGDTIGLTGITAGNGSFTDKTKYEGTVITQETGTANRSSGTSVYTSDVMSNGGDIKEIKEIQADNQVSAERMITYKSAGDRTIQASEMVIATHYEEINMGERGLVCVFAEEPTDDSEISPHKQSSAGTSITGVSSARITSSTELSNTGDSDGIKLEYRADITIPIGFNETFAERIQDNDNDGKFEDLNGNGRLDMNDLVLFFENFRWMRESNLSKQIDFNENNRADYADITALFNRLQKTGKDGEVT